MNVPNKSQDSNLPNFSLVAEATNDNDGDGSTTSSYLRRQSTGSFTAGSDSVKALTIISDMLETYNKMIEANTNSIKENATNQDANFAAMRSALESVIDAINGISQRALSLEDAARENADKLATISDDIAARNDLTVHARLVEFQRSLEENTGSIVELKERANASSESMCIIECRLSNLESRVSNIERLMMGGKKQNQNAAKMA
jgi:predicted  nucleic acid-binding Zn-ribbon protein